MFLLKIKSILGVRNTYYVKIEKKNILRVPAVVRYKGQQVTGNAKV